MRGVRLLTRDEARDFRFRAVGEKLDDDVLAACTLAISENFPGDGAEVIPLERDDKCNESDAVTPAPR